MEYIMSDYTNQFQNLSDDELRQAFIEASKDSASSERFFNSFTYVSHLFNGNYHLAFEQGRDLLNRCQAFDQNVYISIHKGTPYYWLGGAAYLLNDFETVTFFLDAAVTEDITKNIDPQKHTPAIKFMLLEGESNEQAAFRLVRDAQAKMQRSINIYNGLSGHKLGTENLTLPILRTKLLEKIFSPDKKWKSIVSTIISFSLEWDYRNQLFDLRPSQGTNEPFFLHLFKGCLLFESLLKNNPNHPVHLSTRETNLGKILQLLHNELDIDHDLPISDIELPTILTNLIVPDDSLQKAIQFTGRLRNTLGHNLGWDVVLDKLQYQQLFEKVISSCLYAITCLY
jgi:hypothetical protein